MLQAFQSTSAKTQPPTGPSIGGSAVNEIPAFSVPQLSQPQSDEQVLSLVKSSVKGGESYRQRTAGSWEEFRRKFNGDFYTKQPRGFESRVNKYKEFVDRMVTVLTQQPHQDYCVRLDESDQDVMCDIHTRRIKDVKKRNGYREKEVSMIQQAGVFGPGVMKVFYDRSAADGMGDPNFIEIDRRYFGVNPGCKRIDEARYCFYKRAVALSEIQRNYPDKAANIKPDPAISLGDTFGHDISFRTDSAVTDSVTGATAYFEMLKKNGFVSEQANTQGDQVFLIEFFYRDPRAVQVNDQDELAEWVYRNPGFGGKNDRMYQRAIDRYTKKGFPPPPPVAI